MEVTQNQMEQIRDWLSRGELTSDQANVEMVRIKRVELVTCRIPAPVRRALNDAVKAGLLGHVKKDGRKPEAYYHPSFKYLVAGERQAHENSMIRAIAATCIGGPISTEGTVQYNERGV